MAKKAKSDIEQAKSFMDGMNALAEKLYAVRQNLSNKEQAFKELTDELYKSEAELKGELLEQLQAVCSTRHRFENGR